jgi:hypothetical protein
MPNQQERQYTTAQLRELLPAFAEVDEALPPELADAWTLEEHEHLLLARHTATGVTTKPGTLAQVSYDARNYQPNLDRLHEAGWTFHADDGEVWVATHPDYGTVRAERVPMLAWQADSTHDLVLATRARTLIQEEQFAEAEKLALQMIFDGPRGELMRQLQATIREARQRSERARFEAMPEPVAEQQQNQEDQARAKRLLARLVEFGWTHEPYHNPWKQRDGWLLRRKSDGRTMGVTDIEFLRKLVTHEEMQIPDELLGLGWEADNPVVGGYRLRRPKTGQQTDVHGTPAAAIKDAYAQMVLEEEEPEELQEPAPDRHAVHYSSTSAEHYTPAHIVALVRDVLGVIDLDPASCAAANEVVKAHRFFDREQDGLAHGWYGRVYLNPPYGDEIGQWTAHLDEEYATGNVDQAIALLPARTDTQWFQPLFAYPRCWVRGRLRFGDGKESAPFPSVLVYFGPHVERFREVFGEIGYVDVPVQSEVAA